MQQGYAVTEIVCYRGKLLQGLIVPSMKHDDLSSPGLEAPRASSSLASSLPSDLIDLLYSTGYAIVRTKTNYVDRPTNFQRCARKNSVATM